MSISQYKAVRIKLKILAKAMRKLLKTNILLNVFRLSVARLVSFIVYRLRHKFYFFTFYA
jgi:hypothetical protein